MWPLLSAALLSVAMGEGFLCNPPPRRFNPEMRRRLPPPMQNLAPDDLNRLPRGYIRNRFGPAMGQQLKEIDDGPCGASQPDADTAQKVMPGGLLKMEWQVDKVVSANCQVKLICPGRGVETVLWVGPCGERLGRFNRGVLLPESAQPCGLGECFLQWSMRTPSDYYCNCVDVIIPPPSLSSTVSSSLPTSSSSLPISSTLSQTTISISVSSVSFSSLTPSSSSSVVSSSSLPTSSSISSSLVISPSSSSLATSVTTVISTVPASVSSTSVVSTVIISPTASTVTTVITSEGRLTTLLVTSPTTIVQTLTVTSVSQVIVTVVPSDKAISITLSEKVKTLSHKTIPMPPSSICTTSTLSSVAQVSSVLPTTVYTTVTISGKDKPVCVPETVTIPTFLTMTETMPVTVTQPPITVTSTVCITKTASYYLTVSQTCSPVTVYTCTSSDQSTSSIVPTSSILLTSAAEEEEVVSVGGIDKAKSVKTKPTSAVKQYYG